MQALVWVDWAGSGSATSTEIEALLTVVPATPVNQYAQKYLEAFSKANWGIYCLAHLLTYTDFSGTLGEQYHLLFSNFYIFVCSAEQELRIRLRLWRWKPCCSLLSWHA